MNQTRCFGETESSLPEPGDYLALLELHRWYSYSDVKMMLAKRKKRGLL